MFEDPRDADPDALWPDLRPSEARRLASLVAEAMDGAAPECECVIVRAVSDAGLAFAR